MFTCAPIPHRTKEKGTGDSTRGKSPRKILHNYNKAWLEAHSAANEESISEAILCACDIQTVVIERIKPTYLQEYAFDRAIAW